MKLLLKQRFFSLLDSFDIYDEWGAVVFSVEGQFALGHCLKIYDRNGMELGTVKQKLLTFLPQFELYAGQRYMGCIQKEFTFFRPSYNIDCNGWHIEGDWLEWDYSIVDSAGRQVACISKELMNWTDTYFIEVHNPADALCALMVVLAVDAEKCSRSNN